MSLLIYSSCHDKPNTKHTYKETSDIQIKQIVLTEPMLSYDAQMLTYSKKLPVISDKTYPIQHSPFIIRHVTLDNRNTDENKYWIESIMDTVENTAYSFAYLDDFYYLILGGKYFHPKSNTECFEWAVKSHINLERNMNYFLSINKFINKMCATDSIKGFKLVEQILDSIIFTNQYIEKIKPDVLTDTFIKKYYENYYQGKIKKSDSLLIRNNFDRMMEHIKSLNYIIYQRHQAFYEIKISQESGTSVISINFLNGDFFYYPTW